MGKQWLWRYVARQRTTTNYEIYRSCDAMGRENDTLVGQRRKAERGSVRPTKTNLDVCSVVAQRLSGSLSVPTEVDSGRPGVRHTRVDEKRRVKVIARRFPLDERQEAILSGREKTTN
jgi:hypothetical protein